MSSSQSSLLKDIQSLINREPYNTEAYEAYYQVLVNAPPYNPPHLSDKLDFIQLIEERLKYLLGTSFWYKNDPARASKTVNQLMDIQKRALLLAAYDDFDSYIRYIEWDRETKKQFYLPRRAVLRPLVEALQSLEDDRLDLLSISMPPGTGKTTLAIFYLTWLAGRHPEKPILTASHSNDFIRGVYDECLRILDPNGEYLWHDVFPNIQVTNTNAKDCRIDLDTRKRFETLEFTSIGTGNAGLYRAVQLLYCDDLVKGIEVALSKERLDKLWETYTADLRQRKMNACKELHIATRWSVHDVIGRLEATYGSNPRCRFIVIPALNEADESNFDYLYGVGFSTETYREQRRIMEHDKANWKALYMNEPIEREGQLYSPDELQRYFDLPDTPPDAIISVCDTKDKGSDYCVMPIAYQYGQSYYIEEILCDNSNPDIVDLRLIEILLRHKVQMSRFESNSAGGRVAKTVQEGVTKKGGRTKITTKFTTANKETKIIMASPFVKEYFFFKDESKYTSEYRLAMNMICGYTTAGKNKHDDTVDALAQLAEYIQSFQTAKVEVRQRLF